jgi:hypothetical protein
VSTFDRIEEQREQVVGLVYEEHRERVTAEDPSHRFWRIVTSRGCQIHDDPLDCEGPVQAAHLIPKQALRKRHLYGYVWDPRNGIGACYKAHRRSDAALERFPARCISSEAREFAAEVELTWMLERLYGGQA